MIVCGCESQGVDGGSFSEARHSHLFCLSFVLRWTCSNQWHRQSPARRATNSPSQAHSSQASMGKKKSKTAKKKQAKAASRAKQAKAKTTAFGVSVVKGSKGRGGATGGGGGHGGNDHAAASIGHNANKKGGGSGGRNSASSSAHHNMQHDATRRAASMDDERNDFDRQHASLQERAEARQRQQKEGGKKRGNRKHQQHMQQPQSSSLFTNLAQSSIKLGPATVGEMVDDAADRVAAGMTAIGAALSPVGTARRPAAPPNTPSSTGGVGGSANMLQVLAAQKRQEWSAQKYMLQPESKPKDDQMGDNRFAGLDNGDSDSDDNGWGAADGDKPVDAPPAFNFAPASFAFGHNNAAGAQQQPGGDDDPDL